MSGTTQQFKNVASVEEAGKQRPFVGAKEIPASRGGGVEVVQQEGNGKWVVELFFDNRIK